MNFSYALLISWRSGYIVLKALRASYEKEVVGLPRNVIDGILWPARDAGPRNCETEIRGPLRTCVVVQLS